MVTPLAIPSEYPGLHWVAWHRGGDHTLRIGKRHLARTSAIDRSGPRETLCGHSWKRSAEVIPNDYWTTGDCAACVRAAAKEIE